VEVQFVVAVLARAQWVKQSVVSQLLGLEFLTGVRMVMKLNHHLPKMAQ
jgi:hypothetical protein